MSKKGFCRILRLSRAEDKGVHSGNAVDEEGDDQDALNKRAVVEEGAEENDFGIEGHKFKGFRHLILRGPRPFPLLVGANGSGKVCSSKFSRRLIGPTSEQKCQVLEKFNTSPLLKWPYANSLTVNWVHQVPHQNQ